MGTSASADRVLSASPTEPVPVSALPGNAPLRVCQGCGKSLKRRNKSGRCKPCFNDHLNASLTSERRSQITRATLLRNPEFAAAMRARTKAWTQDPENRERWRRRLLERPIAALGAAAITPEVRARAGQTRTARALAWCPPRLRDDYRQLASKVGAQAAREAILASLGSRR